MKFSRRAGRAAIALAATVCAAPLGATELAPGLLYDRVQNQLVVMEPRGGVAALAALDGRVVWESREVDRPIALDQTRLLAQQRSPTEESIVLAVYSP